VNYGSESTNKLPINIIYNIIKKTNNGSENTNIFNSDHIFKIKFVQPVARDSVSEFAQQFAPHILECCSNISLNCCHNYSR
jgi:hypothetical protein